jgi:hypothetical protein
VSHYTVLVIGEDVEAQLAPYDEEIQVDPYKEYWDSETIRQWERILSKADAGRTDHPSYSVEDGTMLPPLPEDEQYSLDQIAATYNKRYASDINRDENSRVHIDDGGIYEWSTYNPKSKWDWYQVGGRWNGFFMLKKRENEQERWHDAHQAALDRGLDEDAAVAEADRVASTAAVAELGAPGAMGNGARYDADVVLKGDVDAIGMRMKAAKRAGEAWDRAHAVIGDIPEAESWETILARHHDDDGTLPDGALAKAREEYGAQPRVKAAAEHDRRCWEEKRHDEVITGLFESIDQYQVPRTQYCERAADTALAPYAFVKDGEWYGRGEMGWWGMSLNEVPTEEWDRRFNEMFDELPDDTRLTLVDCHI